MSKKINKETVLKSEIKELIDDIGKVISNKRSLSILLAMKFHALRIDEDSPGILKYVETQWGKGTKAAVKPRKKK